MELVAEAVEPTVLEDKAVRLEYPVDCGRYPRFRPGSHVLVETHRHHGEALVVVTGAREFEWAHPLRQNGPQKVAAFFHRQGRHVDGHESLPAP